MTTRALPFLVLVTLAVGCGDSHRVDGGTLDAYAIDGGGLDGGGSDGDVFDAGGLDTGPGDDASADGGLDAGSDAGTDGGLDAGSDTGVDDAGMCSILGDYSVMFMGVTAYFRFAADGTWTGAESRAALDTSTLGGTYTLAGSTFTITDGPDTGCMTTDTGTYTLAWSAGCATFTLTLVSDACAERSMTLSGATFTRL